jgi:hypothetical protein
MSYTGTVPLLVFIIVGLLLGVLALGFLRVWRFTDRETFGETHDDVLVAFLALAAFVLGAFLTFLAIGLH